MTMSITFKDDSGASLELGPHDTDDTFIGVKPDGGDYDSEAVFCLSREDAMRLIFELVGWLARPSSPKEDQR